MNALENFLLTQIAGLFSVFYGWAVDKIICLIFGNSPAVDTIAMVAGIISGASFFIWCAMAAVHWQIKKSQEGK